MKSTLGKSSKMEPFYQYLTKEGLFETMKDVMLLAIAIGFKNGEKRKVEKYGGDSIKEHIFRDDMAFLNLIAILDQKDTKILLNENKEKKYIILEQYAEAGMEYLVDSIFNGNYTNSEKIIDFAKQYTPKIEQDKKDLTSLFDEIINNL